MLIRRLRKGEKLKITVFTPTYNRAYIIKNLYDSLKRQTFKDFEWLVIDDGSTDETEELFSAWQNEENDFPVRYYKQENAGKCAAINRALDLAKGELFFTVDSDDYLTDDALGKIANWEKEIPEDEKFCGFAGNIGFSETETQNILFEGGFKDGTLLDRYKDVDGERAFVFYTDVHREYMYPVFDGEKFMTEAVAYNRMAADGYKMRFYNDIIYSFEYREDGLTKAGSRLFLENPKGYGLWLREKSKFEHDSILRKLKMYYAFTCDLLPRYSCREISGYIGAPCLVIMLCKTVHELIQKVRK